MSAPVVVLTNVLEIDGNPYLRLWGSAVRRSGARLLPLEKATVAGRGAARPAWVHLQWPERTLRNPMRRIAARDVARLLILLAVARCRGARVMVTAHNVWSHDRRHRRLEGFLWRALGLIATDLHLLSFASEGEFVSSHPTFARTTRRVIPHGNYEPVVGDPPSRSDARDALGMPQGSRVLLTFGLFKGYKGVEELLEAFAALEDPLARLVVAGRVLDERLARRLAGAEAADARVIVAPRFLDDAELARFVRASDWVVLPYRRVLNSGSALLALTLGRPVLLPRTPSFEGLRREVGDEWVTLYDGSLATAHLSRLERRGRDECPDLSWCSWDRVTGQLSDLWRETRTSAAA